MSLASPYQEHYYVADGVTTSFSFGEYFTGLSQAYVKCIIYFDDGTNCVPTFTVDMTTGFITIVTLTKPDGTVLTVPPAGSIVRVFRDTPEQQNVTASQLQNYTAKQLERIFDSVVAMIQEVSYSDLHKTIRLTETQRDVSMEQLKEENDQAILYWDFETRQLKATDYGQNQVVKSDTVDRLVYLQPEGKIYFIPKGSNNPIAIGSATIHNDLGGRNAPDCHPESAITGLREHLQELRDKDSEIEEDVQIALNRSQEAKDTADEAKGTAEYAQTIAGQAKDIAEDAKEIAEGIEDIAEEAKNTADEAKGIAEDAKETAEGIEDIAQEAKDTADEAKGIAQDAVSAVGNKIDKTTVANKVYGTDAQGNQTTYDKGEFGQVDDVQVNDVSVVTNKVAKIDLTPYVKSANLATVATTGDYDDLSNKPTIPTVNNPTITITQGGVTKGSFTLNQATGDTIALDAGGGSIDAIDGVTITKNNDNEIQAVATINANTAAGATNPVYNWVGTLAEYNAQNIESLHPDWICYITDDIDGGTSVYTKSEVDTIVDGKANTDLSNLTATGVNIANWSSNVSNCITEIPQDIKLELNNGTLTLKAGSKVYVPNGMGVFDEITTASDLTTTAGTDGVMFVFIRQDGTLLFGEYNQDSGTSTPTNQWTTYYNTNDNKVYRYTTSTTTPRYQASLPIAKITISGGAITSIDQVFNGFGYIGSTVFVLPGVKGLIPDGRNADGTLKSIELTVNNVLTSTGPYNNQPQWILLNSDLINSWDSKYWIGYNRQENILFNKEGSSSATSGSKITACVCAFLSADANQKITSFTPKTAFRAVDYSDTEYIGHQAMPSNRYIDLTLGASGSTYKAPADGYFVLRKQSGAPNQQIRMFCGHLANSIVAYAANDYLELSLPISKGQGCTIYYSATGATEEFSFVFLKGAQ